MCGDGTVTNGGHNLSQSLGAHVTNRKNSFKIGSCRLVCHNIAAFVEFELIRKENGGRLPSDADEKSVEKKLALLAAHKILDHSTLYPAVNQKIGYRAIP